MLMKEKAQEQRLRELEEELRKRDEEEKTFNENKMKM